MSLKKKTIPFEKSDYNAEVNQELNDGKEFNALFLIHGYIEAYLREWLFTTGKITKDKIKKTIIKATERISFTNMLRIHVILGNIDDILYDKISRINNMRNKLAHELIEIDVKDTSSKKKIRDSVLQAITICDEIFRLYKSDLDKKAQELTKKWATSLTSQSEII